MKQDNPHFLIVGAGLAGCCVGIQLLRKGAQVTLLDSGENHSSAIAAGLINPLVFRRMTKSWRVDEFTPYLEQFYTELGAESGSTFFHSIQIRRIFAHEQERELWLNRQHTAAFSGYMEALTAEDNNYPSTSNRWGTARVRKAYSVDVIPFLQSAKSWIAERATVLQAQLNYDELKGCDFRGTSYAGVIFCEGYQGKDNPWFGDLPLGQTKGETLQIRSDFLPENESLNLKCFVLPRGSGVFKIGATYGWHNPTTHCTEEGRAELLEKIGALTDQPFEILEQSAGVRPTSIDRRPFMGEHDQQKNYFVFNGLGTKGYMIAPLLSKEFAEYLLDKTPLDPEVDIVRFSK